MDTSQAMSNQLHATIKNGSGRSCGAPIDQMITIGAPQPTALPIIVTDSCTNPVVSVQIKDKKGTILDEKEFSFVTPSDSSKASTPLLFAGIVALAVVILFLRHRSKKAGVKEIATIVAILVLGSLVMPGKASADTYYTYTNSGDWLYSTVNLGSATYPPTEEPIGWTAEITLYSNPYNPQYQYVYMYGRNENPYAQANGWMDQTIIPTPPDYSSYVTIAPNSSTGVHGATGPFTSGTQPGTYYVRFRTFYYDSTTYSWTGDCYSCGYTIGYTVVPSSPMSVDAGSDRGVQLGGSCQGITQAATQNPVGEFPPVTASAAALSILQASRLVM